MNKVSFIQQKNNKRLDDFMKEYKAGKIQDAILIYRRKASIEPEFMTLTNSPYAEIGWLTFQTLQALFMEQALKREEDK